MRDEGEFMVGSIGLCETFWEQEILKHHPDKELLISWVKGVKIETFLILSYMITKKEKKSNHGSLQK